MKAVSTYWHTGPTRWGMGETAHEAPAQLDYIFATATLGFAGKPDCNLYDTVASDHLLLGVTLTFPNCEKDYFHKLQSSIQEEGARLPKKLANKR